jgi:predicted nucleotidyltransferase
MLSREFIGESQLSPQRLVKAILNTVPQAGEIWFYGSRARGDHRETSDWDILVMVPDAIVGSDFMDIQIALDKLSQKFADHDIQAGHSWTGLYREAQQEGRLLWRQSESTS